MKRTVLAALISGFGLVLAGCGKGDSRDAPVLPGSSGSAAESGVTEESELDQGEGQAGEDVPVHKVEFVDFLVERCVREALGKGWSEDVTEEELSSMRKLTLSWEKDITLGLDFVSFNRAYSGYVNLADLSKHPPGRNFILVRNSKA